MTGKKTYLILRVH